MKTQCFRLLLICLFFSQSIFSQVAVNTTGASPNSSAMLDVSSTNKGVLMPRVSLQSLTDNSTVPSPAYSLMVYNTNAALGVGFYFNSGTAGSPTWQPVSDLPIPYHKSGNIGSSIMYLENYSPVANSAVYRAYTVQGVGLHTESASGYALQTVGKIQISGNSQTIGAGKVLTSDAQGNATWQGAIAFSARGIVGGGSLQVNGNGGHKIGFASVQYNLGNAYTDANGIPHSTFNAPVHGIYHFDVQLSWEYDNDDYRTFTILMRTRNGVSTEIAQHEIRKQIGNTSNSLSLDIELLAGDIVYVVGNVAGITQRYLLPDADMSYFNGRLEIKLD